MRASTVRAFVDAGCSLVGVSNYSAWQTARAYGLLEQSRIPLTVTESEYSLVRRSPELEIADAAISVGVGLLP